MPSTLAKASDTEAVPSLVLVVVVSVVVGVVSIIAASVVVVVVVVVEVVGVEGVDTGRVLVVLPAFFDVKVVPDADADADADDCGDVDTGDVPAALVVVTKLTTSATSVWRIEAKSNFLPYNPNEMPSIATVTNVTTDSHGSCFFLLLVSPFTDPSGS